MMRSGNPALRGEIFTSLATRGAENTMTIQGTTNKTFILLGLTVFGAFWAWNNPAVFLPLLFPAVIMGFIVALVTVFNKTWSPVSAPIYAFIEGIVVGGISLLMEKSYPGIVFQAVVLTFGVLFSLLVAYKSRLIKVTENFRLGIVSATGGIAIIYIISIIMSFFGARIPFIHES